MATVYKVRKVCEYDGGWHYIEKDQSTIDESDETFVCVTHDSDPGQSYRDFCVKNTEEV